VAAARDFNGRWFSVDCLGELFKSAESKEQRLMRLIGTCGEGEQGAAPGRDAIIRWWCEAQLHLHAFCQRTKASVVDIARRGFEYEKVCDGAIFEQVFYVVLGQVTSVFYEVRPPSFAQVCHEVVRFAQAGREPKWPPMWRGTDGDLGLGDTIREPIRPSLFHNKGFVSARDSGCGNISDGAPWCEVLRTLICLLRGESYCRPYSLCGCDEDGDDNFM